MLHHQHSWRNLKKIAIVNLRPRPPDIFENGDFFLRFSLSSTRKRLFRVPKTQVFKNFPQSGDFWKPRLFEKVMMSCIIYNYKTRRLALRMLCKGCYHISIVLAFSCGQAKTIPLRYGGHVCFEKRSKNILFSEIAGCVWTGPKTDL